MHRQLPCPLRRADRELSITMAHQGKTHRPRSAFMAFHDFVKPHHRIGYEQ
jgi:hypothetical protein